MAETVDPIKPLSESWLILILRDLFGVSFVGIKYKVSNPIFLATLSISFFKISCLIFIHSLIIGHDFDPFSIETDAYLWNL